MEIYIYLERCIGKWTMAFSPLNMCWVLHSSNSFTAKYLTNRITTHLCGQTVPANVRLLGYSAATTPIHTSHNTIPITYPTIQPTHQSLSPVHATATSRLYHSPLATTLHVHTTMLCSASVAMSYVSLLSTGYVLLRCN